MAAPLNQWSLREAPHFLRFLRITQSRYTPINRCHLAKCLSDENKLKNSESIIFQNPSKAFNSRILARPLVFDRSCVEQTITKSSLARNNGARTFTTSSANNNWSEDQSHRSGEERQRNMLKLMNFPLRMLPNPLKALRNVIMEVLVRRMDRDFSRATFLEGAQQAVLAVSSLISHGCFNDLHGLVDAGAVHEIRENYKRLNATQRQMILIDPDNIQARFIYEIGMMWDELPERKVEVEVTTVFHCVPVAPLEMDKYQVCNYRFIRQYSETLEPMTDWTINRLNHFLLNDIAEK